MASVEISWPIPMRAIGAQNLLTMPGGVTSSGYLHKKGGSHFSLMKWPLRYIIIHKGCVYYFKTSTSPTPQGAFSLNGYNRVMRAAEETTSNNVFPFKMVHFSKKHRTWYFSAASEDERRKWMRNLRKEIDYYNDRRDSLSPSDSDSDTDSFYGSIERPMTIRQAPDHPEDDYLLEDDDDDEEDYIKPDGSPTSTGRPTIPPPSYPPPPVPAPLRQESMSVFFKCIPPPVPGPNKSPTSPLLKKTPMPLTPPPKHTGNNQYGHKDIPNKGPPPPLPFAPHLPKPSPERSACGGSKSPLPLPPHMVNLRKQLSEISTITGGGMSLRDRKPAVPVILQTPATLPICRDLERKLALGGSPSPHPQPPLVRGNYSNKPSLATLSPTHRYVSPRPAGLDNNSAQQQASPLQPRPKPGLYKPPLVPKPPPPMGKPSRPSLQSPQDGQSFRTSVDEMPTSLNRRDFPEDTGDNSDEDYDNIQLPDSVFVDTTETSNVERLFKESSRTPQDGLYCIRNSGSKTSQVLVVWDVSLSKARNYRLFQEDSRVFLEVDVTFPSLAALVEHYHIQPLPNNGSLCLQKPYGYIIPR